MAVMEDIIGYVKHLQLQMKVNLNFCLCIEIQTNPMLIAYMVETLLVRDYDCSLVHNASTLSRVQEKSHHK